MTIFVTAIRYDEISNEIGRTGCLPRNSCRAFRSYLIFFRLVVTYGMFHIKVSALTLYLNLERWSHRKGRGSGSNMRIEKGSTGIEEGEKGEYKKIRHGYHESFNETRNSFASYIFSPSCTWTASSRWGYPYLGDPGLRHIYLVRNVLCASARTRDDNGFQQKSRISIRSNNYYNPPSLCYYWQIYLLINKLPSVLNKYMKERPKRGQSNIKEDKDN